MSSKALSTSVLIFCSVLIQFWKIHFPQPKCYKNAGILVGDDVSDVERGTNQSRRSRESNEVIYLIVLGKTEGVIIVLIIVVVIIIFIVIIIIIMRRV